MLQLDVKTVGLLNVLACVAWIIGILTSTTVDMSHMSFILTVLDGSPTPTVTGDMITWVTIFTIVAVANLVALITEQWLSKHYAGLGAVVLWTTISALGFVNGFHSPSIWLYSVLAIVSFMAYLSIGEKPDHE